MSTGGSNKPTLDRAGAMALSESMNVLVGSTPLLMERPEGATLLVLYAQKGGFTLRLGDFVSSGMPAALDAAASLADGNAGYPINEKQRLVLSAPLEITAKGYAADSALHWYWL